MGILIMFCSILLLPFSFSMWDHQEIKDPDKLRKEINIFKPMSQDFFMGARRTRSLNLPGHDNQLEDTTIIPADYDKTLWVTLQNIALDNMQDCSLTIVYEAYFDNSLTLESLLALSNGKRVFHLAQVEDMNQLSVEEMNCNGYFFLLNNSERFLNFASDNALPWDFNGWYVVVTESLDYFNALTKTPKVLYTEHVIGLTMSNSAGKWMMLRNKFYWGGGSVCVRQQASDFSTQNLFSNTLRDFDGALVKVITFEWAPNIFYEFDEDGNQKSLYGMDIELLKTLAKLLNFQIEFIEPPKGEYWGSEQTDGSWSGLVGKLMRREGDIGVANMFISSIRKVVIDYTSPYNSDTACFLLAKPSPLPRWQSLLFPFKLEIWIAYVCSVFVCGLAMTLLLWDPNRVVSYCMLSFQIHVREPTVFNSAKPSIQIFFGILWLYAFIITSFYSSNLTAFLTITREPRGIETILELHHSGKIVGAASYFFKGTLAASEDPMIQSFADDFQVYKEEEDLFAEVNKENLVYLQNRLYLEYKMATRANSQVGHRGYRIMKECLNPFSIAMGLPKNSPLKKRLNVVLQSFVEAGLVRKWFVDSLEIQAKHLRQLEVPNKESEEQSLTTDSGPASLGILHLQGVFMIFAIGNLLAIVAFFVEFSYFQGSFSNPFGKKA